MTTRVDNTRPWRQGWQQPWNKKSIRNMTSLSSEACRGSPPRRASLRETLFRRALFEISPHSMSGGDRTCPKVFFHKSTHGGGNVEEPDAAWCNRRSLFVQRTLPKNAATPPPPRPPAESPATPPPPAPPAESPATPLPPAPSPESPVVVKDALPTPSKERSPSSGSSTTPWLKLPTKMTKSTPETTPTTTDKRERFARSAAALPLETALQQKFGVPQVILPAGRNNSSMSSLGISDWEGKNEDNDEEKDAFFQRPDTIQDDDDEDVSQGDANVAFTTGQHWGFIC